MKTFLLMVAGASLFAACAHAAPSESDRYAAGATARAHALLAAKGVDTQGQGVSVRATVNTEGNITSLKVIRSSGSTETDQAVANVLRSVIWANAPSGLTNGAVTLNVGKSAIVQASAQARAR
ncbi:TonB family protein [Phenylobacterium sp.]|jgi:TonB family protein|uniref:TonB family protein n=1 Tax=Phenylobacterium sp. TaxID=1871053 RepID=UPI002F415615